MMRRVLASVNAKVAYGWLLAQRALRALWRQERNEEQPREPPSELSATVPKAIAVAKPRPEPTSRWVLKREILDRLDEYFICIRRLKRRDPDSYELFSRVGFAIPAEDCFEAHNIGTGPRLGFGGIALPKPDDKEGDVIPASFIYFRKMESVTPKVAPFPGAVYSVVALYDDRSKSTRWRSKLVVPVSFHVGILHDGTVMVLKELVERQQVIRSRRPHKGGRFATIHHRRWRVPELLEHVDPDRPERTRERRGVSLFCFAYQTYRDCVSEILIAVEHEGVTATFGMDLKRAPYFFRDREPVISPRGAKARIFHSVREHARSLGDGRVTNVKFHYRGLRRFAWNGYAVRITWPDASKVLIDREGVGGHDLDAVDEINWRNMLDSKRAGEKFAQFLDQ